MAKKGIHLNVYRLPGAENIWRCDIKINRNNAGEGIMVSGTSADEEDSMMGWSFKSILHGLSSAGKAISKARQIAQKVISNPAIAATFPQYAAPALAALSALEQAEKHGLLGKVKTQLEDPTLRKLASEMDEMSKGKRAAMSGGGVCLCDGRRDRGHRGHRGHRGPGNALGPGSPPAHPAVAGLLGADFPAGGKPAPFGLASPSGPFGLPQGNPHPWAEFVRKQIAKGVADPLELQKLARMWDYQRRMARNSQ
jgi:hypothetical protein